MREQAKEMVFGLTSVVFDLNRLAENMNKVGDVPSSSGLDYLKSSVCNLDWLVSKPMADKSHLHDLLFFLVREVAIRLEDYAEKVDNRIRLGRPEDSFDQIKIEVSDLKHKLDKTAHVIATKRDTSSHFTSTVARSLRDTLDYFSLRILANMLDTGYKHVILTRMPLDLFNVVVSRDIFLQQCVDYYETNGSDIALEEVQDFEGRGVLFSHVILELRGLVQKEKLPLQYIG